MAFVHFAFDSGNLLEPERMDVVDEDQQAGKLLAALDDAEFRCRARCGRSGAER